MNNSVTFLAQKYQNMSLYMFITAVRYKYWWW